jgi:hypothetical protein
MEEEQSTGARKKTVSKDRTTEEVFLDHLEKRKAGLVEEDIQENYAPDWYSSRVLGSTAATREFVREAVC